MNIETLQEANSIMTDIDCVSSIIGNIENVLELENKENNEFSPTVTFKMVGSEITIKCNEEKLKKLFRTSLKTFQTCFEKEKKELEKQFEKL